MLPPAHTAAAALLAIAIAGCQTLPTGPAAWSPVKARGITLTAWASDDYLRPASDSALRRIASLGAGDVALLLTAYQPNRTASAIALDPKRSPSLESIGHAAALARSLGLEVTIKLHIESDDGSWRAFIAPDDPAAWFASYRDMVLRLASFCDSIGARRFVVGTELAGTVNQEERWRGLIRDVRGRYRGELLYAASWDEAPLVPFWDALDAVGIDFYFPVADRNDPNRFDILEAWQTPLALLHHLHMRTGKRVILTEIGYRSIDGAGRRPYDFTMEGASDPAEQADLYWGALEAVGGTEWIDGLFWWEWPARASASPTGYSPAGKPAERELRRSWRGEE